MTILWQVCIPGQKFENLSRVMAQHGVDAREVNVGGFASST